MSAVVVSAAVAGGKSAQERIRKLSLVNPFKRRRRSSNEDVITEETALWLSDSGPERRLPEGNISKMYGYGSASETNLQGQVGNWSGLHSNPTPHVSSLKTHSPESEVIRDSAARPRSLHSGRCEGISPSEENEEENEEPYVLNATPYYRLVRIFFSVPIAVLLTLLLLIVVLRSVWSSGSWSSPFLPYFGLFFGGAATWTLSFALRIPLYLLSSFLCGFIPTVQPLFSTLIQVLTEEVLRLYSLIFAHIRLQGDLRPADAAFPRIWALALGWATAEAVISVWQGYEQLALYKDVLSPDTDDAMADPEEQTARPALIHPLDQRFLEDPEELMNDEIEQLMRFRARIELEQVYGIPVPNIPVFVSILQRIDSIILSLAFYLLMSSSYLSNLRHSTSSQHLSFLLGSLGHMNVPNAIQDTIPTFLIIVIIHTLLSFGCTNLLPRIGIHAASYLGCIIAFGALFTGLGRWDAL